VTFPTPTKEQKRDESNALAYRFATTVNESTPIKGTEQDQTNALLVGPPPQ
jgi:hypothetical protein